MKSPVVFGKYLLLERISVGGMAEVFVAKSFGVEGFERLLAIKRILPAMAQDEDFIGMFVDEARIGIELNHANVAHVHELGKHNGSYFIAMEYISGRSLRSLLEWHQERRLKLPLPQAVFIAGKVCEALDYAHRKKDARGHSLEIIHRDVSPQNILLSYEGDVKIIDFGIAKAANRHQRTEAGILKGKFGYMSPEQVEGAPIDRRSDVFAVGCVLYEMLTGEKLFAGTSDFSTLDRVRNAAVPAAHKSFASIPAEVQRVLMKALARDPEARYAWASDLQEDLSRYVLSQGSLYTAKHLSTSMQEIFADELEQEEERLRRFARVERPHLMGLPDPLASEGQWENTPLAAAGAGGGADIATVIVREMQSQTHGVPVSAPPVSGTESRARAFTAPIVPEPSVTAHKPKLIIGNGMNFSGATTVGPVGGGRDDAEDSDRGGNTLVFSDEELAARARKPDAARVPSIRAPPPARSPRRTRRGSALPAWLIGFALSVVLVAAGAWWFLARSGIDASAGLLVRVVPPEGTRVSVGGEWVKNNVVTSVAPGAYEIVASRPGFQIERRTVVVAEGETQVVTLQMTPEGKDAKPPPVPVSVEKAPPQPVVRFSVPERDVAVYLDGKLIGKSPGVEATGLVPARTYAFTARREGYKPYRGAFRAPDDSDLEVAFRMERSGVKATAEPKPREPPRETKAKGRLACSTNPAGAEVWVDGKPTGRKTPVALANPLVLPVGNHEVVFKFEGSQSTPLTVAIKDDEVTKLVNVLVGG